METRFLFFHAGAASFLAPFRRFRELFLSGFKAVQRHMREIETLIWPMFPSSDHRMATQVQTGTRPKPTPAFRLGVCKRSKGCDFGGVALRIWVSWECNRNLFFYFFYGYSIVGKCSLYGESEDVLVYLLFVSAWWRGSECNPNLVVRKKPSIGWKSTAK